METIENPVAGSRLEGIDVVRFLAFIGVVFIHTASLSPAGYWAAGFSRFAVPFFFLTSGFLMSASASPLSITWKTAKRLVPAFVFWATAYIITFGEWPADPVGLLKTAITGGPAYHLWFLPALGLCVVATAFLRRFGWPVAFIAALSGYLAGLVIGSYSEIFGPEQTFWNPRNGLLFGLIFVVLGGWIKARGTRPSLKVSILAFAGFTIAHLVEMSLPFQRNDAYRDFFILTLPVGVAALFVALGLNPGPFSKKVLAPLGRLSLGLYGLHAIVIRLVVEAFHPSGLMQWLGVVAMATLASVCVVWPMSKVPYLKRVVS